MSNKKISALTGATTPLGGTELVPITQGGVTVNVSVANLTVGRAVGTAGGTFTDNQNQGTAAKGINFTANTPAAGMTSQLLNWYEEGTWTPTDQSGAGLSFTVGSAKYTRTGRQVTCMCSMSYPVTANTAGAVIGGLPFASGSNGGGSIQGLFAARTFSIVCTGLYGGAGSTSVVIDKNNGAAIALNVDLTGATMYFTLTYFIS